MFDPVGFCPSHPSTLFSTRSLVRPVVSAVMPLDGVTRERRLRVAHGCGVADEDDKEEEKEEEEVDVEEDDEGLDRTCD